MVAISEKQQTIAKLKSQGKTNRDIAKIVYPNTALRSAEVLVSRHLNKANVAKYVDKGREAALRKYGITWDRLISKLNYLLDADKVDNRTGEVLPDHSIQLNALKTLITYIDKDDTELNGKSINSDSGNPELLQALSNGSDVVELQRIMFNKKPINSSDSVTDSTAK